MSHFANAEWRTVPGFTFWEVSSEGDIRSRKTGRVRKCTDNGYGYLKVNLSNDKGQHKTAKVHVLVALAFHGPRPQGMQVAHVDGNRHNNQATNLTYASPKENALHMRYHGTAPCPIVRRETERDRERKKRAEDRAKHPPAPRKGNRRPQPWKAGELNPQAKLTAANVQTIRTRSALGQTMVELAREFGVSAMQISRVVRGLKWRTCSNTNQGETTRSNQASQDGAGPIGATGVQVAE